MSDFTQWRPHPWHGLAVGPAPPTMVTAYVEITPFDVVKYEWTRAGHPLAAVADRSVWTVVSACVNVWGLCAPEMP